MTERYAGWGAADQGACAAALVLAFADDPVFGWLFPADDPARSVAAGALFDWQVRQSLAAGELGVRADGDGNPVAVAVWLPFDAGRAPADEDVELPPVLVPNAGRLRTLVELLDRRHPRDRAHLYLPYLGVVPDRRGRGWAVGCWPAALRRRTRPAFRRTWRRAHRGIGRCTSATGSNRSVPRWSFRTARRSGRCGAIRADAKTQATAQKGMWMTVEHRVVAGGGDAEFMTVRHLTARGSQADIGRATAGAARDTYGWKPVPADPVKERARRRWFERNWPQHHARMRGAASALGLDPDDDRIHLDGLSGVPDGSACSALALPPSATEEGRGFLGRNYDFFLTSMTDLFEMLAGRQGTGAGAPVAGSPYVITSVPDDGPASAVLTMNELDGCMEGVNAHGLGVALLIADAERVSGPGAAGPQVGLSTTQLPRFLLDTCATVDEAQRALLDAKQYDLGMPLHYLVADAAGNAFVWERGAGGDEYVIDANSGAQCVTNHPLHRHRDPAELPEDNEESMLTYQRYRTLHERSTETGTSGMSGPWLRAALDEVRFDAANAGQLPIRTLWRSVIDLDRSTLSTHFYLGDTADGGPRYSDEVVFPAGG